MKQSFQRNNFDPRSNLCVFLGYFETTKGYMWLNHSTKKLILFHIVTFESSYTYESQTKPHIAPKSLSINTLPNTTNQRLSQHPSLNIIHSSPISWYVKKQQVIIRS